MTHRPLLNEEQQKELDMIRSMSYEELNERAKQFPVPEGKTAVKNMDKLTESEKVSYMKTWTEQQKLEYLMQNTITEEECFEPIFDLIDKIGEGCFNDSNI